MIKMYRVSGTANYTTGGFTVNLDDFKKVEKVLVKGENTPGNMKIKWAVTGNKVTIQVFTIAADTTTGAISETEVAAGTDLSSYFFTIVAEGL